jgi:hypothetical protein
MKRFVVVLAFTVFGASRADASLILAGTFNGFNFCATDNNTACGFGTQLADVDPTAGRLELANQVVNGVQLIGASQQAVFGPTQNILNTSFLQATNQTGSTITGSVSVSATNFIPPVFTAAVSGAATFQNAVGSSTTSAWYNDPTNTQGADFALDRPGIQLATFSYSVTQIADAFAFTQNNIGVSDLNPFSMTLATDFTLVAGGQVTNRGMTEIKQIGAVPEPTSLILLGCGLVGLGYLRRRQMK